MFFIYFGIQSSLIEKGDRRVTWADGCTMIECYMLLVHQDAVCFIVLHGYPMPLALCLDAYVRDVFFFNSFEFCFSSISYQVSSHNSRLGSKVLSETPSRMCVFICLVCIGATKRVIRAEGER
jgi:hypothetical protein